MKIKLLATIVFLTNSLLANSDTINLEWLKDKPRTYAKDFYIWQYLKQDITPDQAMEALGQANYVNNRLFYLYAKKINHDETYAVMQCIKAKAKTLVSLNPDCIENGLSVYKTTKLNNTELNIVYDKVLDKYPLKAKIIDIVRAPIPFTKLISSSNEIFFETFNNIGSKFRTNYFNYRIPKKTLIRLIKDEEFNQTLKLIVTNNKLNIAQKSLLDIDDTDLTHLSSFLLAINAIKHNHENALTYLESAYKKAYYQLDKDKVLFWKFLYTGHSFELFDLAKSWDINIYSLYAKEYLKKDNDNIIFNVSNKKYDINYEKQNISSPFFWITILNDLKKLNEEKVSKYENLFTDEETVPHLTFIYERYYQYKNNYFITPYKKYLENYDKDRQALIYAIGRQESRFIPSSISTAYAMGVMQIMPFLSKAIAEQLNEEYNIHDQLKPEVNLKFANFHLNYLESQMKHPLLIAYAYNGGIGFTRKMLKNGFFDKNSEHKKFEPFLSMELVPYDETRKYGKKVLANYFIYKNNLDVNNKVSINTLFETLLTQSY